MSRPNTAKNVILIMTDQHRFDCLGLAGHPTLKTPHLDSLAADGICYRNAFTNCPTCTPSRYSMLTGLYSSQTGVWSNGGTLPAGYRTWPMLFRENGFNTTLVGKMHLTPTYQDVGFERMLLSEQCGDGRFEDDHHATIMKAGEADFEDIVDQVIPLRDHGGEAYFQSFGAKKATIPAELHSTSWIGTQAVNEVKNWQVDERNLLCVSFVKPHHPFDPPEPWASLYNPETIDLPPSWTAEPLDQDVQYHPGYFDYTHLNESSLRKVMALYYGSITQIDHEIGRLVAELKAKNLYENSLIVFTSDHGEFLGFHHLLLKSNFMYDPVMRIPFLMKFPQSNSETALSGFSEELVSLIDLAPTLLRSAGINELPNNCCPGKDLQTSSPDSYIYAEEWRENSNAQPTMHYMLRTAEEKLLLAENQDHCRYFKLANDPYEFENLYRAAESQDRIAELTTQLLSKIAFISKPNHIDLTARTILDEDTASKKVQQNHEAREYFKNKLLDGYVW